MKGLFLDDEKLTFEKMGYEARLSEDPNDWPQEILDELFKQAPFTSDYTPRVVMRSTDPDKRYGMGQIELMNTLSINPRDDATPPEVRGQKKVVIPVIINDGRLAPLDLLLSNGEVEPLTDERLRRAMFRPSLFEAIKKRPGDMSLIEQLYPPQRQYGGARGPLLAEAGGGMPKASSAKPYLLDAILPTIKKAHVASLTRQLNQDHTMRSALFGNDAIIPFMAKLAQVELNDEMSGRQCLEKALTSIPPTVVQIQKIAGGFRIKTANPEALIPTSDDVPRPEAVGALGGDLVSKAETDGTVTVTSQPAIKETLDDELVKVVDEFGLHKVRTVGDNRELVGWVFPKVVDLDGTVLPLAVFSNGSEAAIQENIAGTPVARNTDMPDGEPRGTGCFYYTDGSGATGLVPVSIKAQLEDPEGISYNCNTVLGESVTVVLVPGLKTITPLGNARVGIPDTVKFMPLPEVVDLVSSPEDVAKTAMARKINSMARVITDGICYSFDGPPIDKIAGAINTTFLDKDGAVFLGAVLGHEPAKFAHMLDSMRGRGVTDMMIPVREATPAREKVAAAMERAQALLDSYPDLRAELFKEAAPLDDPTSVDKVLSVGFINPENLSIFASYTPEIEGTVKKLSELLLASRLGHTAVDEGALQKAVVHLDKVVAGLKTLSGGAQA